MIVTCVSHASCTLLPPVQSIMEANILHFDLKCDNVLLEPLPGVAEAEFWAPQEAEPPFRVVLADFGESKLFTWVACLQHLPLLLFPNKGV